MTSTDTERSLAIVGIAGKYILDAKPETSPVLAGVVLWKLGTVAYGKYHVATIDIIRTMTPCSLLSKMH